MATINNIVGCIPERQDKYFVDTNVWYWFSAPQSEPHLRRYQVEVYPKFLETILDEGGRIFHSPFSYIELSHVVEKNECKKIHGEAWHRELKRFRADTGHRELVLQQIDHCWKNVISVSECLKVDLDADFSRLVHACLSEALLDPYDACYCAVMKAAGVTQIVSDDSDFSSVEGVELFTANQRVLAN